MEWEKPSFVMLASSAEIGAYQDDFDRPDEPPFVDPLLDGVASPELLSPPPAVHEVPRREARA